MLYDNLQEDQDNEAVGVMVDIETTGFNAQKDEIVNIAAVPYTKTFTPLGYVDMWFTPISTFIPNNITVATGLDNLTVSMFSKGDILLNNIDSIESYFKMFEEKGLIFTGQNTAFDYNFIDTVLKLSGKKGLSSQYIDLQYEYSVIHKGSKSLDNQNVILQTKEANVNFMLGRMKADFKIYSRHTGLYDCANQLFNLKKVATARGANFDALKRYDK